MIRASIIKSASAWDVVNEGRVLTATGCSSLFLYLYTPSKTSPKAPCPSGLFEYMINVLNNYMILLLLLLDEMKY